MQAFEVDSSTEKYEAGQDNKFFVQFEIRFHLV